MARLRVFLTLLCFIVLLYVAAFALKMGEGDDVLPTKEVELFPSLLLESVSTGDVEGVLEALSNGENLNTVNEHGWSSAMFAVAGGNLEILDLLITRGIDLNNPTDDGVSPLMLAATLNDKEMVETLLRGNADPLQISNAGLNAYDYSVVAGRKVVSYILAEAVLIRAMDSDNMPMVLSSIENGAYVNIHSSGGWTPLIYASFMGDIGAVNTLIELGADLNRRENDGWTALHFAAGAGNREVVEKLLEKGADGLIPTIDNRFPRQMAAAEGHKEIAELLPEPVVEATEEL